MREFSFNITCGWVLLALAGHPSAVFGDESQEPPAGQRLFETHGCTNCHGPDGIHPESKYAPVLRGKSADYLFEHASAIFGGQSQSEKTRFMHDQFCIGQTSDEGCYPPPSLADLRVIAEWLGGPGEVPEKKKTPQGLYVTAVEAYDQLQALGEGALLLDVRTRSEVAFLGMPTRADANIPYMTEGAFENWDDEKGTFKLVPNSEFTLRVNALFDQRGLGKDAPVFLICRSGDRSAKAANLLSLAGYTKVYTIIDGYEGDAATTGPREGERVVNGWKNSGLPWSYRLERAAMYWEL